jgi:hypothetical protein
MATMPLLKLKIGPSCTDCYYYDHYYCYCDGEGVVAHGDGHNDGGDVGDDGDAGGDVFNVFPHLNP